MPTHVKELMAGDQVNQIIDDVIEVYELQKLEKSNHGDTYAYIEAQACKTEFLSSPRIQYTENICELDLAGKNLRNSDFLSKLPSLRRLILSKNKLDNLDSLTYCKRLEYVDVSWNQLTTLPDLGELPYLRDLRLNHNLLMTLQFIRNCRRLRTLNASHNKLTSAALLITDSEETKWCSASQMHQINNLRTYNQLMPFANPSFWTVPQLEDLDLSYNAHLQWALSVLLRPNQMTSVKQSPKGEQCGLLPPSIVRLKMNGCHLSELRGLINLQHLHTVELRENSIRDFGELGVLQDKQFMRNLDLRLNPVTEESGYQEILCYKLKQLNRLDGQQVTIENKVKAKEYMAPSMKQAAANDHRVNIIHHYTNNVSLRDCTLPTIGTSYPILALIGPIGSHKRQLACGLVRHYPTYFGLLKSHTDIPVEAARKTPGSPQKRPESARRRGTIPEQNEDCEIPDGKKLSDMDAFYHHVTQEEFEQLQESGEFVQTAKLLDHRYGLSWTELNSKALQGLAGVFTGEMEAKLSLQLTCLRPKYILCLPEEMEKYEKYLRDKVFSLSRYMHRSTGISTAEVVEKQHSDIEWCLDRWQQVYRQSELQEKQQWDAVIHTDNVEKALEQLLEIIRHYIE